VYAICLTIWVNLSNVFSCKNEDFLIKSRERAYRRSFINYSNTASITFNKLHMCEL
jgi:hypothetical protein